MVSHQTALAVSRPKTSDLYVHVPHIRPFCNDLSGRRFHEEPYMYSHDQNDLRLRRVAFKGLEALINSALAIHRQQH